MKGLTDLLTLGDTRLYEICEPVTPAEAPLIEGWVADLHNVMQEIRATYHFGRGIAAPQIGVMKRLFYIHLDRPIVVVNPALKELSEEKFELWDDCMCFPNLLVRVKRHASLTLEYVDAAWRPQEWRVQGDLSELIQHEYDHLDGVLCTMRALDDKAFRWRK